MNRLRALISKLAAIGAVRRKGVGALQAYGGKIEGRGTVTSKETGEKTHFVIEGGPAARN